MPLPPSTAKARISYSAVLSGTIGTFDKDGFKSSFAAALEGVEPEDVSVEVAAASVRVDATIISSSNELADQTMATLTAFTPETLTAALNGFAQVETVETPVVTKYEVVEGDDAAQGVAANGAAGLQTGTLAALVLIAAVMACGALFCVQRMCCGRGSGRKFFSGRQAPQRIDRKIKVQSTMASIDYPSADLDESSDSATPVTSSSRAVTGQAAALQRAREAKQGAAATHDENPFFTTAFGDEFKDEDLRL